MPGTEGRSPRRAVATAAGLLAVGVVAAVTLASSGCRWRPSSVGSGSADVRGVVLVVVDALRADHLDTYGYPRSTAPRLDRRAAEGVVFDQARSPAPWTLPSVASMLTGLYPSRHGAGRIVSADDGRPVQLGYSAREMQRLLESGGTSLTRLDSSWRTLAEVLRERGFETGAIVNNLFLEPALGFGQGFSRTDAHPTTNASIRRADATVDAALAWLEGHSSGAFFLLVHLMDPHLDYDPPPSVRGRFTSGYDGPLTLPVGSGDDWRGWRLPGGEVGPSAADRDFVRAAYDEEILFVDRQLDRFFAALQDRSLLEDSLVVLTADHGEEFWDHGGFEHGHSLYDELLRVPLVLWTPGATPGRRGEPVSLVDLYPTILEATASGPPPVDQDDGVSLWSTVREGASGEGRPGRALFASGTLYGPERQAVIRWPMKGIHTRGAERWEIYDLARDPDESVDLGASRAATIARLQKDLEAIRRAVPGRRADEALEIDEETLRSLRALGYLDGGVEEGVSPDEEGDSPDEEGDSPDEEGDSPDEEDDPESDAGSEEGGDEAGSAEH